ncbi:hypothetical protein BH10ACI1_BH10ACI1_28970 [soil metagenome]
MLTTIEAEIDVNGEVTFLEPIKITKKSRAIITLLDDEKPSQKSKRASGKIGSDENARQLEWLKANRDKYAGKYVALDGDNLVAHADTLPEIRQQTKKRKNLFIVKVFAEETVVSAGL